MLHVDFHGKYAKKDPKMAEYMTDIDIGHMSMKYYWKYEQSRFVEPMGDLFAEHLTEIYKKEKVGGYKIRPELEPYLHGFWGKDLHTMTSQASKMGIPSF